MKDVGSRTGFKAMKDIGSRTGLKAVKDVDEFPDSINY